MSTLYCIGDSLTFGPGVRVSQKWTTLAASEHLHIVNMGVSGDTTAGMLARIQALTAAPVYHSAPGDRPMVLVMGGTNDIFFSGSDTAARGNLAAIVHQLSAAGYRVLVGIPLPVTPENAPQKWANLTDFHAAATMLEDYCAWLRSFAAAFDIPTVDLRSDFIGRSDLFADGLHPNAEGHRVIAKRLLEALA